MDETMDWFCLRSRPKQEHIAAAQIRQWEGVEVFCPRIRFRRNTRAGAAWATEALFPGYLFARFDAQAFLCQVRSARGVSGIVRFGNKYPMVPERTVEDLRQSMGSRDLRTVAPVFEVGGCATIGTGVFHGLQCVIHSVMPARRRIAVLIELLGQTNVVELNMDDVIGRRVHPMAA